MVSPAGCKRLLFTHSETVWTVIHPTQETTVEGLESAVLAKSYTELGWDDPAQFLITAAEGATATVTATVAVAPALTQE